MDIQIINENITILENSDTTVDNVQELALLYIVRKGLKSSLQTMVDGELKDVFPAYTKYIEAKRKFQLNEIDEFAMVKYMQLLCNEIKEFIETLYHTTDTRKERVILTEMSSYLYNVVSQ